VNFTRIALNSVATHSRAEHRAALRVQTACEFSAVRAGVSQIAAWLAELELAEADLGAWELALTEAGNNAVKYSPPEAKEKPVIFELSAGARDIRACVTDHTAGFDWPAQVTLPEPDAEHGRGLYLMKSLTDHICYLRSANQNILVLKRNRPAGNTVLPDIANLQRRLAETETALGDMTAELAASYESLVAVFRYSAELGGHADLMEFSNRLLRDLMQIAEADGVILRLVTPDGKKLETALVLPDTTPAKLPPLAVADNSPVSIELRAARSRVDLWFSPEEPLDKNDPLRLALPVGNGICHAFCVGGQLVGTAALGRLAANRPFTAAQVNLLHTFVDFLAIQIVNARLLDERTAARVTRRELEIAADIQRSLLPARLPSCPPFSLAAGCTSALQIGGDFYDVIAAGEGAVLLVIADVMGKGVPAALFAAVFRTTIRSMCQLFPRPGELLATVNRILFPDLSRVNMFITAALVYVDPQRGNMISASAGHCPMLFCGPESGPGLPSEGLAAASGFPLGIEEESQYGQTVHALPPGASALLYTDGLSEARNAAGEQLGEQRLREFFSEAAARTNNAEMARDDLLRRLAGFRGQVPLTDDQTLILILNPS
jgi:serine phosphatase RsbU (regulator of sigma subunit)/anti-sigma regulatory factor (Ser/Thr protein kinase)